MSFFSKIRALTLGNMHQLLDQAIDLNSPAVLEQYVRDLETGISQLRSEAVIQAAGVRTLNREIGDLQTNITAKTTSVKSRLSQASMTSSDPTVREWALQITGWQKEVAQKQEDLTTQKATATSLDTAVAKLDAKHTEMVSNVRRLKSAAHTTKAKNNAADALESAGRIASSTDGASIDNLASRIQEKKDIADEKFDRAMTSDAFAESADQTGAVDDFLTALK